MPEFLLFLLNFPLINCGTCKYLLVDEKYHCELKNAYVILENSTLEIAGDHIDDFSDEHVQSVSISSSVIHYLDNQIFEKFPLVEEIHFHNVEIFEIKQTAFNICNHLQVLSIEDEDLQTLPPRAFQNCSKIKEITIKNQLKVLPDDVFYGVVSLEKLDLGSNKFEKIPDLSGLINLNVLVLTANKISNLEVSF